jgi:hypothetical protein
MFLDWLHTVAKRFKALYSAIGQQKRFSGMLNPFTTFRAL